MSAFGRVRPMTGYRQQWVRMKKEDVMVTTNDVKPVGVDQVVRVILRTMWIAYRYRQQRHTPAMRRQLLKEIADQLEPLVKIFGRRLDEQLGVVLEDPVKGFVLDKWAFYAHLDVPEYLVCYSDHGWFLLRKVDKAVFYGKNAEPVMDEILGTDLGCAHLFIDMCDWQVQQLFKDRMTKLEQAREEVLLGFMYRSFDSSKFVDTRHFVADLE